MAHKTNFEAPWDLRKYQNLWNPSTKVVKRNDLCKFQRRFILLIFRCFQTKEIDVECILLCCLRVVIVSTGVRTIWHLEGRRLPLYIVYKQNGYG